MVVEARNITLPAGSNAVLPCHNQRIVWRQDRLRDRQRVVHWDMYRTRPHEGVERVLDLFPGGTERLYNNYNKGRISLSPEAFDDGNFSLIIHSMETLSFLSCGAPTYLDPNNELQNGGLPFLCL